MQVFIVRPFGTKQVVRASGEAPIAFDFDRVQAELIEPVLRDLELDGGTTGRIFAAGEIREDMFSELLLADVVIADISIHNANVFYELGIRNALRDRTTILIKCPGFDATPFDIIGYRYVSYDREEPGKAAEALKTAIRESRNSGKRDSPVFNMLPKLEVQDLERFYVVPPDFNREVVLAAAARDIGKLALLAAEAIIFDLEFPALKAVGEALFSMKAYESGRSVWEKVLSEQPGDCRAIERLATIYQRLAEAEMTRQPQEARKLLIQSDESVGQLLERSAGLNAAQRAEAFALKGRNAKTRWVAAWMAFPEPERPAAALQSGYWAESLESYEAGFYTDLNHCYSGINALALLTVVLLIAEAEPGGWSERFAEDDEAEAELARLKKKQERLSAAVRFSLEAERSLEAPGETNIWLEITQADFVCLTNPSAAKVRAAYKRVMDQCDKLQSSAIVKQLLMYRSLRVLPENIDAALSVTGSTPDAEADYYYILFTGHMIDAPGRPEPRFPPEKEAAVRSAIREKLVVITGKLAGYTLRGIAGGACGGDILFHEVCAELGIASELYLALPRAGFLSESVSFAGNSWVERFDALYEKLPRRILADTKELPRWLSKRPDYSFWERNNLWMLQNALVGGGHRATLIALWNGQSGDGPGGTRHMVAETLRQGGKTVVIDINQIG